MCGRASSARSAPAIRALTGAVRAIARSEYRPSWNVGPGNRAPVLRRARAPASARDEDEASAPAEAAVARGGAAPVAAATPDGAGATSSSAAAAAAADAEVIDDDSVVMVGDSDDESDPHGPTKLPGKPSPAKKPKVTKGDHHDGGATSKPDKKDDDSKGDGHGPAGGGGAIRRAATNTTASGSASTSGSKPTGGSGGSAAGGAGESELIVQSMRWGILPPYASATGGKQYVINARSETVGQKSLFKRLVDKRQRCIVPVDGFYEWEKKPDPFGGKDKKQPFFIHLPDRPHLHTEKQLLVTGSKAGVTPTAGAPTAAAPASTSTPAGAGTDKKSPKLAAASATSSAANAKWECSACTLLNVGGSTKCSACGKSHKPKAGEVEVIEDDDAMTATATAASKPTAAAPASSAATNFDDPNSEETDTLGDAVLSQRPLMLLAGLYDEWTDSATGEQLFSYTILTTDANSSSAWLHDRLPLILDEQSASVWLDTDRYTFADCLKFVKPYNQNLVFYAVSTNVNSMRNKGIECVEPLESVTAKSKAGGIAKFFNKPVAKTESSAATATGAATPGGSKSGKSDSHSWPGAVDAWKSVEDKIAAYNKRHTGGSGAGNGNASGSGSSAGGGKATTSAKATSALNTGKRKDSDAAPRSPPKVAAPSPKKGK